MSILKMKKQSRFRYLFLPYSVLLTYVLLAPDPLFFLSDGAGGGVKSAQRAIPDYVYHFVAWTTFYLLLAVSSNRTGSRTALISVLYSTLVEFLQPIFGRTTEVKDLTANLVGIGLGALIVSLLHHWTKTTHIE